MQLPCCGASSETQGQIKEARESLNGRENVARRKVKNGEKSPWGQCLGSPRMVVAVDIFSFSQFRAPRDQVVNGLVQTATQSTFWVHVRLLEDVVLVPACWESLILGCDDQAFGFCLEASCFSHLWVLSWSTSACFTRCGYLPWSAFDSNLDLSCWRPWCLALAFVLRA